MKHMDKFSYVLAAFISPGGPFYKAWDAASKGSLNSKDLSEELKDALNEMPDEIKTGPITWDLGAQVSSDSSRADVMRLSLLFHSDLPRNDAVTRHYSIRLELVASTREQCRVSISLEKILKASNRPVTLCKRESTFRAKAFSEEFTRSSGPEHLVGAFLRDFDEQGFRLKD